MTSEPASQSGPPDDPEQLRTEIEQTREHLGDTVDQLAACRARQHGQKAW